MSQLSKALEKLGVVASSTHTGTKKEGSWEYDSWKVEIIFQDRRYTCQEFKTGLGHRSKVKRYNYAVGRAYVTVPKAPEVADVISCLISDANSGMMNFDDFCSEFGYDTDSRKALAVWEQCVSTAGPIKRLLGKHFESLMLLSH